MAETWGFPNPISFGFWLENPSRSGGVSLNGVEQNVVSLAMRWRARGRFRFRTKTEILAARALFTKLQGKAGTILVPFFDGKRVSWPIQEATQGTTDVVLTPGRTRNKRLDGTPYEDPEVPSASEINATVVGSAPIRSVQMDIAITQGGDPLAGQYFGIGNHGYVIHEVLPTSGDGFALYFLPPLREAVTNGMTVKFTRPVVEMRQMTDDQGIQELEAMRFAEITLDFIEVF